MYTYIRKMKDIIVIRKWREWTASPSYSCVAYLFIQSFVHLWLI